jgi:hypothetical protein
VHALLRLRREFESINCPVAADYKWLAEICGKTGVIGRGHGSYRFSVFLFASIFILAQLMLLNLFFVSVTRESFHRFCVLYVIPLVILLVLIMIGYGIYRYIQSRAKAFLSVVLVHVDDVVIIPTEIVAVANDGKKEAVEIQLDCRGPTFRVVNCVSSAQVKSISMYQMDFVKRNNRVYIEQSMKGLLRCEGSQIIVEKFNDFKSFPSNGFHESNKKMLMSISRAVEINNTREGLSNAGYTTMLACYATAQTLKNAVGWGFPQPDSANPSGCRGT